MGCTEHESTVALSDDDSIAWCCDCGSLYMRETGWIPPADVDEHGHASAMLLLQSVFGAYVGDSL